MRARPGSGGLVEHQDRRVMDDGAGDRDLLLLARRKALGSLLGERAHVEAFDHAIDPAEELTIEDAAQLREVGDVLARGEAWVDADLRRDHAYAPAHLLRCDARVESEHLDRSGIGGQQRADDAQGRRLARAIRSQQPEDLAGLRLEGDAAQHLVRTQCLFEAVDPDRRRAHFFLAMLRLAGDLLVAGALALDAVLAALLAVDGALALADAAAAFAAVVVARLAGGGVGFHASAAARGGVGARGPPGIFSPRGSRARHP